MLVFLEYYREVSWSLYLLLNVKLISFVEVIVDVLLKLNLLLKCKKRLWLSFKFVINFMSRIKNFLSVEKIIVESGGLKGGWIFLMSRRSGILNGK